MDTPPTPQSEKLGKSPSGYLKENLLEAARFWEPRRLIYNLVLAAFVVLWIAGTWPHFRPAMNLEFLLFLIIMALLANLCYCAAYFVDIPMQFSALSKDWGRSRSYGRWGLWLLGTLLAIVFENYWLADEVYPFVR